MNHLLNSRPSTPRLTVWLTAAVLLLGVTHAGAQDGLTIYALTSSNQISTFNSSDPCTILSSAKLTGLDEYEDLLGIDVRPATGWLYGLGSSSRIYVIDPTTGSATAVGTTSFTPALEGSSFGFDFNPVPDRIRVTSDTGQNLRLNPDTGEVQNTDGVLAYAASDVNEGAEPEIVGSAYTNPDTDPTTGTTLYNIDAGLDLLAIQNPPNDGALITVSWLNIRTSDFLGFDIAPGNVAYAATVGKREKNQLCGRNSALVTIDLATGAATRVGPIGTKQAIRGIAVAL